jgi:aminopeptidase N
MRVLFEDAFGPFPFGSHAVLVTNDDLLAPLSAHGLSVFPAALVDPEVDVAAAEPLIAQVFARQWFGASLTAHSWRHAWLHEGFALYASWLWGDTAKLARKHWRKLAALPQDLTLADPGVDRIFDERVAIRGALTLHALRVSVGDDAFFALLRDWSAAHRHGDVSTEQFVDAATSTSASTSVSSDIAPTSAALRALLHSWIEKQALPTLPDSTA